LLNQSNIFGIGADRYESREEATRLPPADNFFRVRGKLVPSANDSAVARDLIVNVN